MIIEEEDFKLIYDDDHDRFDVYTVKVINAKDLEKRREEYSIYGYSMTLEGALRKIINMRISKRKESYFLKEYLKEYKDLLSSLKFTAMPEIKSKKKDLIKTDDNE